MLTLYQKLFNYVYVQLHAVSFKIKNKFGSLQYHLFLENSIIIRLLIYI